jgi:hypothetical protein
MYTIQIQTGTLQILQTYTRSSYMSAFNLINSLNLPRIHTAMLYKNGQFIQSF